MTPAGGSGTSGGRRYALRLSAAELARYRAIAERARIEEADLWIAAGIVDGARVVDLGCGPGTVLTAMAERVGPRGWVTGVDTDPEAVEAARHAIVAAGLRNAEVRFGDAAASGLGAGSVDVAVLRLVLAHNGRSEQAIVDHAATLVRPGGCVYLVDVDATLNRLRPPHPGVLEMIDRHRAFQDTRGNDLQAGLRLGDLLTGAGLDVVDHHGRITMVTRPPGWRPIAWAAREAMVAEGFIDAADLTRWELALAELDQAPARPTSVIATFFAIGRHRG